MDPSGDKENGRTVLMTFDVVMKMDNAIEEMVAALDQIEGVSELKVIASKENFITMQEMGRSFLVEGIISFEEFERVLSV